MADNIDDAITEVALGPAQASDKAGSFTAQDLDKLLKVKQFLASQAAADQNHMGLRFVVTEPGRAG